MEKEIENLKQELGKVTPVVAKSPNWDGFTNSFGAQSQTATPISTSDPFASSNAFGATNKSDLSPFGQPITVADPFGQNSGAFDAFDSSSNKNVFGAADTWGNN